MAGEILTLTETTHGSVKKIRGVWESGDGGESAVATTASVYDGKIIALITDLDGTAAPTDNYDITAADADGDDVLAAGGLNRDTANVEVVTEGSLGAVAGSELEFTVANAGNSKEGVFTVWIR